MIRLQLILVLFLWSDRYLMIKFQTNGKLILTLELPLYQQTPIQHERKKFWIDVLGYPVLDRNGSLRYVVLQHYDITDTKLAQDELLLKDLVFETSITANSMSDKRGLITHVNATFIKTWGCDNKEEAVGKGIGDFIKFENETAKIIAALNETGEWEGEYTGLRKDGTTFSAYGLGTSIKDKSGEVIGYQSAVLDISDQKQAEEALLESEKLFRGYFELGLIGMIISSTEKGWIEFNDTLCNMFGYSRENFTKTTWQQLTHPDDLDADLAYFNRVLAGEINGYSMEKRFFHKNGSIIHTKLSVSALRNADGSVNCFLALLEDITKRKQAEKALRKSEEKYRQLSGSLSTATA